MIRTIFLAASLAIACSFASASDFKVCDSVLVIPAGTKAIDEYAFQYRDDFKSVRFEQPCTLREIGRGAFSWCGNLESVELPESLADLKSQAFAYCVHLKSVSFPARLTHVGANCFSFCTSLAQVSLPASVKELESYAFSECVSLRQAVLPANGNLLGELIFSGCRELQSITINSNTPPEFDCNSTLFEGTENFMYDRCVLHVPVNAVARYRKAAGWSLFKKIL